MVPEQLMYLISRQTPCALGTLSLSHELWVLLSENFPGDVPILRRMCNPACCECCKRNRSSCLAP